MGFHLSLCISTPVSLAEREKISREALARWPFIREPRVKDSFPDRVLFSPPELTEYLFDTQDDYDVAVEQAMQVEDELSEWSRTFPEVTFAYIEADCFGGRCEYTGRACRDGSVIATQALDEAGHTALLRTVGLECDRRFEPFVRGFFAGRGSGGFE